MSLFGDALKAARKSRNMSQQALAEAAGVSQGMVAHWEVGRKQTADMDTCAKLEVALGLNRGELAQHLPDNHPAKRAAAVEIPVAGVVAAGAGYDAPAEPGEVLRVSEQWAGCVAYRVRGNSMLAEHICEGDYLIVRPMEHAKEGEIVVAWLADHGHVVKKLADKGYLRSGGKTRWAHKLTEDDRIFGVLEGVVRLVGGKAP